MKTQAQPAPRWREPGPGVNAVVFLPGRTPAAADAPAPKALLVSVNDAQVLLGLGRTKVKELIRDGQLPVIRIGRTVRIERREIEAFIKRARQPQKTKTEPDAVTPAKRAASGR